MSNDCLVPTTCSRTSLIAEIWHVGTRARKTIIKKSEMRVQHEEKKQQWII